MTVPTVVLTGGSSGLGWHVLRLLLARTSARIVVPVRSRAGDVAVRAGLAPGHDDRVITLVADLSSRAGVRTLSAAVTTWIQAGELGPIVAVVLNAAVLRTDAHTVSADGVELTMATNALGPHLLLGLLSSALDPQVRIVAVGSGVIRRRWWHTLAAARRPHRSTVEQQCRPHHDGRIAYASSKLALFQLCRTLGVIAPQGMSMCYFDPGLMPGTRIARDSSVMARTFWRHVLPRLMRTTADAAVARSAGALADVVDSPTVFRGEYVGVEGIEHPEIPDSEILTATAAFRSANRIAGLMPAETAAWWY